MQRRVALCPVPERAHAKHRLREFIRGKHGTSVSCSCCNHSGVGASHVRETPHAMLFPVVNTVCHGREELEQPWRLNDQLYTQWVFLKSLLNFETWFGWDPQASTDR